MKLKNTICLIPAISLAALLVSCGEKKEPASETKTSESKESSAAEADHGDHAHSGDEDHAHDDVEVALGEFDIDGISVKAAQGHGNVEAGKEGHLVITLPYKDDGASLTRAWIGTEDRTMSSVGKGEYAASHNDYDIHAVAPDPLPDNASWWLEIEKPDGTKAVGSIPFLKNISK